MTTSPSIHTSPGMLRVLVRAAERDLHRLLAEALAPLGVTPAQAEVLAVLAEADATRGLSLHELGARLVCETGSPSRLVQGLVRTGLVAREPAPDDARRITLRLTPAGAERAAQVAGAEAEFQTELRALLADTPVAVVLDGLRRLVAPLPSGRALRLRFGAGTRP